MINVLYTSSIFDASGYAEAARNYICALLTQQDINVSTRAVSFEDWKTDLGKYESVIRPTLNKKINPDVQIIHLTPENFPRMIIKGIKNIGLTVWETSKLPEYWVPLINQLDEVWVPCEWNVDIFRSSGVTIPVKKIPHAVDISEIADHQLVDMSNALPNSGYKFYSIFQWSSRKNPEGLIKAYLSEFNHDESVNLILKTYLYKNNSDDRSQVIELINKVKRDLQVHNQKTPAITLVHGALSRAQIISLHKTCNCFVLPHRAEGWGVPLFEAQTIGKPIITTGYSGNLEFMNRNTSILLDYTLTPVSGMDKPTYNGKASWAEPSLDQLRKSMRFVFENQDKMKEMGLSSREQSIKFNWETIGKLMRENL